MRSLIACLVAWVTACVALGAGPDPAATLERIRNAGLQPKDAVEVRSLDLWFGSAQFHIERGTLVPAEPVAGRSMEYVFLGDARFRVQPPDEVEASQLELFTGETVLDVPVRQAVLVIGPSPDPAIPADLPRSEPAEAIAGEARDLYAVWLQRQERRTQGVEPALFRAALGDASYTRYSALWCRGGELGDFFLQVDPDQFEQLSLGQFVPYPADDAAKRRITRHIRHEQRRGRLVGFRYEDVGTWDVWLSSSLRDENGEPILGDHGVEPRMYALDVTLEPGRQEIRGTAKIDLVYELDGRKVLLLDLHPDLRVEQVWDGDGNELFHFRSGDNVYVRLAGETSRGERDRLEIRYAGRFLRRYASRHYSPRDTTRWYPHIGTLDRARYDVTFHWPRHLDLVATGRRIDGGSSRTTRWERRLLEVPGIAVSFELGHFHFMKEQIGNLTLNLAFTRPALASTTRRMRHDTVRTIRDSLLFYQAVFGTLPVLETSVVTVPRDFSQAFLGYVTLSESVFRNAGPSDWNLRRPMRDQTIAHEVAHQWWGNLIGWMSYRDQWLSEAMANYAALLFLDYRGGGSASYLAALSEGWRWSLGERTKDGRTLESVGPLVLGARLNSSKAGGAYQAIVYRKGAVVLAMLARAFSEGRFLDMLNALAYGAKDHVLATDTFIRAMEHMSGHDLDEFARRYIYGTGIPEVYYSYRFEYDDRDGWVVEGDAHQIPSRRYIHRVVRTGADGWDVRREREPLLDVDSSHLMVPIRVELEPVTIVKGAERKKAKKRRKAARQRTAWMSGMLPIEGSREHFRIPVAGKPRVLTLDPRGEVLANFYSERNSPKRVLHFRGRAMAEDGRRDEAERLYLSALAAGSQGPDPGDGESPASRADRRRDRNRDVGIRLDMARMYLDDNRLREADEQLQEIHRSLRGPERFHFKLDTTLLESRIRIRRGEHDRAFEQLRKLRPLIEPRSSFDTWQDYSLYLRFHSRRSAISEALAMYALTAHLTGQDEEYRWAVELSADRGCDLGLLP